MQGLSARAVNEKTVWQKRRIGKARKNIRDINDRLLGAMGSKVLGE